MSCSATSTARRSGGRQDGQRFGAAAGVLHTVLQLIESGATHVGVATDHVIESFRNDLWPGYKTGDGRRSRAARRSSLRWRRRSWTWASPSGPWSSSRPTTRWPRRRASPRPTTTCEQVRIWTPDKDLAQCVSGDRVVQVDRRNNTVRNAGGVREKFGVEPEPIPDLLALVGDAADGYPGIPGIGKVTAARLVDKHGPLEDFPPEVLGDKRELALLFKDLATLRTDAPRSSAMSTSCAGADRRRRSRPARSVSATGASSNARSRPRRVGTRTPGDRRHLRRLIRAARSAGGRRRCRSSAPPRAGGRAWPRWREQRPAAPDHDRMDVEPVLVDQVVPHERRGQVGAAEHEVAAGLRLERSTSSGTTSRTTVVFQSARSSVLE